MRGHATAGQAMRALLSSSMGPAQARPAVRQQRIAAAAAMVFMKEISGTHKCPATPARVDESQRQASLMRLRRLGARGSDPR